MKNFENISNIIIESRQNMSISGVLGVEEFDENVIICTTNCGGLCIKGENLHVEKLDLDQNELSLIGIVQAIEYDDQMSKGGFFARLFK